METKICKYCNKEKDLNEFVPQRKLCKDCNKKYMKEYYQKNKERLYSNNRNYILDRPEQRKEYGKKYYESHKEDISKKRKQHRKNNPETYRIRKNNYNNKNPHILAWRRILKRTIEYIGGKKEYKTIELLGYTANELKLHIEKLFTIGMNWENYGEWHIDHVKPINTFSTDTPLSIINDLSNLRPMWATTREIDGIIYEGNLNRSKK